MNPHEKEILERLVGLEKSLQAIEKKITILEVSSLKPDQLTALIDSLNDERVKARIFDMFFNFLKGVVFLSALVAAGTYLYEFYKGIKIP